MSNQTQRTQIAKLLRAFACSGRSKNKRFYSSLSCLFINKGIIIGPYMYTMARPEKTLKYRFIRSTNENGEYLKVNSSYNLLATEVNKRLLYFVFLYSLVLDCLSNAITRTNASSTKF